MRVLKILPAAVFAAVMVQVIAENFRGIATIDFLSFWHASGLILQGRAIEAYSLQPSKAGLLMPLAYPPAFLFFIAPLGLIPFGWSFLFWVGVTGGFYFSQIRKWFAFTPPALYNAMIGQNGFLTAGIFMLGAKLLKSKPFLSGAVFGLLIIKPHLGVLLPIAFIAGRHWKAFLGASLSSAAMLTVALAFGIDTYWAWLSTMSHYAGLADQGRWASKLASVYGLAGWGAQIIAAEIAAVAVWFAWKRDLEGKFAILASATLLVSPYLFTYDAVILIVPLTYLVERNPKAALAMGALMLLPLLRVFNLYDGPNTIPLASGLAIIATFRATVPAKLPYRLQQSPDRLSRAFRRTSSIRKTAYYTD